MKLPFILGTYSMPSPWAGAPGAHGRGVVTGTLDLETGDLATTGDWPEPDPAFVLTRYGSDRVWAVTEVEHGGDVVSWKLDSTGRPIDRVAVATGADGPCHLTIDLERAVAYACHFEGGRLSLLALDDEGAPAELLDVIALPAAVGSVDRRAARSRPHSTLLLGEHVLVADYGRDLVALYHVDGRGTDARLELADALALDEGTGPRHHAHRADSDVVYISNEKSGQVSVLRFSETDGSPRLELVQTVDSPGLSRAPSLASEIAMHPALDVVYMANRRDDSLSVFDVIDDQGRLRFREAIDTEGVWPRHFAVSPDGRWLVLGNQNSDSLVSFPIGADGGLRARASCLEVDSPASIAFG